MAQVGIIMGSDSDLGQMKACAEILDDFGIAYELTIVSAHRTPHRMVEYAQHAKSRGLKVIVAGAGGAAHLPGMVASLTTLPVVGVPILTGPMSGQDALYSIVQMPKGIPVATVAIGNAANAGILAARILGTSDDRIAAKLKEYAEKMEKLVMDKAHKLEKEGFHAYLAK